MGVKGYSSAFVLMSVLVSRASGSPALGSCVSGLLLVLQGVEVSIRVDEDLTATLRCNKLGEGNHRDK